MAEDFGSQKLMKHLALSYPLPSKFHFSGTLIAKKVITDKLNVDKSNRSISFTTDIWTCQHTNHSYISLSAHWVSDLVPSMQSFVLYSSLFSGSHTGAAIANKFESMLETWKILLTNCHMVITDNGAKRGQ